MLAKKTREEHLGICRAEGSAKGDVGERLGRWFERVRGVVVRRERANEEKMLLLDQKVRDEHVGICRAEVESRGERRRKKGIN